MIEPTAPSVAFVLEQTLGHVTHSQNLHSLVPRDERVRPTFLPIPYEVTGWPSRVPGYSNWTVRAGLLARRALREANRVTDLKALFIHTQVPSIFAARWMKRVPTVVSLDATPIQIDALGAQYAHDQSGHVAEDIKWRLNRRAFTRAAHIISWSEWSKQSLVTDYHVPASKVTVLAPGVDLERWARLRTGPNGTATVKILFVGGDLERKGGSLLIEAVRHVRQASSTNTAALTIELHVVTGAHVANEPGLFLHRGLRPNSPELIALYHTADVFCLPTLGDCLPMVLSEAGAAGLPLVATEVGAISEIVHDGRTGLLVQPGSIPALVTALSRLVADADLRRNLGDNAAKLVADRFDAAKNATRIVDSLTDIIGRRAHRA
jgi:glycosyltransferase involved in cell wall biosynthesis